MIYALVLVASVMCWSDRHCSNVRYMHKCDFPGVTLQWWIYDWYKRGGLGRVGGQQEVMTPESLPWWRALRTVVSPAYLKKSFSKWAKCKMLILDARFSVISVNSCFL